MPLNERCVRNQFEMADDYCNRCGLPFSNEYLVYPFGPQKPPLCVSCALAQAGVRANAGNRPVVSRKELRRREKARKQRLKEQKTSTPKVSRGPINIDWSLPEESDAEIEAEVVGRRAGTELTKRRRREKAAAEVEVDEGPDEEVSESLDWIERFTPGDGGDGSTAKKITF